MDAASPTLPGYRVLERLNSGGYSDVYRGEAEADGRACAIKVLTPRGIKSASGISGLKNEYSILQKIDHPCFLAVFACQPKAPRPYLVMEYVPCTSVRDWPGRGRDAPEAARIVRELGKALHVLHERRLVHKDLKPDNALLVVGGVKLIDLAYAEPFGGLFARKTRFEGTPYYAAPELIRQQKLDQRADLYALAVTLYELLTGSLPFAGRSPEETLQQHLERPVPPVKSRQDSLPAKWDVFFKKALAKDPQARFASAPLFLQDLARVTG